MIIASFLSSEKMSLTIFPKSLSPTSLKSPLARRPFKDLMDFSFQIKLVLD